MCSRTQYILHGSWYVAVQRRRDAWKAAQLFAIIEGVDGSGKSSLAEAVAAEIERRHPGDKVEIHHKSPPEQPVLKEYALDYEFYRPGNGHHIVADRHHMGELTYAPIYRKTGPFGDLGVAGFRWVEMMLLARGARTWIADLPLETIRERLGIRGEDYLKAEHVEQVWSRYREIADIAATFVSHVAPDGDTRSIVNLIVDTAERLEGETEYLYEWPTYIGLHRPTVLLVGEKKNGDGPHPSEACFMPDSPNRSGHFLLEALPEHFWKGVGIVNAYETDDFERFLDITRPTSMVALGKKASQFLDQFGLQHAAVPHPAYVKRFNRSKQTEYGELIEAVSKSGEVQLSWK